MENEEIRQYLIDFVEKTLNECKAFTRVYGEHFARKRLEINLKKVYTDISSNNVNNAFYDIENLCITFHSAKILTIADIENNKKLKHLKLHEAIHAIFRRTKEECQDFGIEDGTGIVEFYKDNQELGRGLNEGLTDWICQKAGYGGTHYIHETNIIKILELAIGEDAVMRLANGDIKGNIAQLLKMNKLECLQIIALVDKIYQNEQKISKIDRMDLDSEDRELDKDISQLEMILFEKYFQNEIEIAQKSENLSEETMQRLFELSLCINGGKTQEFKIFDSRLPLTFKNEIYPSLLKKKQETFIKQLQKNRQEKYENEKTYLPVIYKKSWFQTLKDAIKNKFTKEKNQDTKYKTLLNQDTKSKQQQFRKDIGDMSNYSSKIEDDIETIQSEEQINLEDTEGYRFH